MSARNSVTPQYKTVMRLQKKFLVRVGDPLDEVMSGQGNKPTSQIRRLGKEISQKHRELGELTSAEVVHGSRGSSRVATQAADEARLGELEKQLLQLELY
eukprot:TRINITY_DN33879_c0_g1_i1.p2 TRINITY_DN33879_c0_g1~~TRINITY_DN33879_c0_g1_i1.p2  ORF type:complete len:100 (+),score=24.09 TRINITY_DN33879_c0_g1_i1:122-421(+)